MSNSDREVTTGDAIFARGYVKQSIASDSQK